MLARSGHTQKDDQTKDHPHPVRSQERNRSNQLLTYYVITYDLKNTNSTNQGEDLLFVNKPRVVPSGTGGIPQEDQRKRRATIYWSAHPQGEPNEVQNLIYGINWWQKDIYYGSTKLDNRQSLTVQDTRWNHKIYQENYEKLESGTDSKRKRLSWDQNPEMYLRGRCAISITICDAIQSHIEEMHRRIQIY